MAGAIDNSFLVQAATYLGATAIAVPLFKRLKLGTILGFLAAGVVLGQYGLGLLKAEEGVFHVAELGVVLLLFIIGLEVSLGRLWDLRKNIFGLGACQMLVTGGLIFALLSLLPMAQTQISLGARLIIGFALACSSTALALSLLQERGERNSPHGTRAFSILLFQDLAVIPLLAAIPLAAVGLGDMSTGNALASATLKSAAVIIGLILTGRFILNHVFRVIAVSGSREAFAAMALFVVAATALAVSSVGLSMALGAFLAGVLMAESSFRHQIAADIEPFRELLLGLFFIGVGMQLDVPLILENIVLVLGGALVLVSVKGGIIYTLARLFGSTQTGALKMGATLAQGGEFAFVVCSLGVSAELFNIQFTSIVTATVTLSMALTPVIFILVQPFFYRIQQDHAPEVISKFEGAVLLIGFGRMGQIIAQILQAADVQLTILDKDPKRIKVAAEYGNKVFFGDAANAHLLRTAGAHTASAIVFAADSAENIGPTISRLRAVCPNVRILVRVKDRLQELELMDTQTDYVVRETLESSLLLAQETLKYVGRTDSFIQDIMTEFRQRDRDRLIAQKVEGVHAEKNIMQEKPFRAIERGDGS